MTRRNIFKALAGLVVIGTAAKAKEKVDRYLVEENVDASFEMTIKDKNNMTKSEKMHSPTIKVYSDSIDKRGTVLIEVSTGSHGLIHKTSKKHYISVIELTVAGKTAGRVTLGAGISRGFLAIRVKETELKDIEAVSVCNLHGTWRTRLKKIGNNWENIRS